MNTASILSTDDTILAAIGGILLVILAVAGYFINIWIRSSEKREDAITAVLTNLSDVISEVNSNLRVYKATMDVTLKGVTDKACTHTENIEKHEKHIQDHEVRLTVIERKKS